MKKNMIGTLLLSTLLLGGLATPAFAEGQATSKEILPLLNQQIPLSLLTLLILQNQ